MLSGGVRPGERLIEQVLADALQVSRTPVREALHQLGAEGLIVPQAHRGFMVPLPSASETDELLELTGVLEGHAVRLLCERADDVAIAALAEAVREAEEALGRGDLGDAQAWNQRFHASLATGVADRPRLAGQIITNGRRFMHHGPGRPVGCAGCQRAVAAHRDIVLALRLRDHEVCERLMREHGAGRDSLVCRAAGNGAPSTAASPGV